MNKTFNIQLNGIAFIIDEDAFLLLEEYLNELKKHFGDSIEGREIIGDIEGRMVEILSEKLSSRKEVITKKDIEELIKTLGRAKDLGEENEETNIEGEQEKTKKSDSKASRKENKKLYRDPDDKKIGGVASGLGHYFGVDATFIRIVFLVLILTATAGVWIYIILWAAMPEANTTSEKLEMKGEAINLSNLEKAIREEVNNVAKQFKGNHFGSKLGQFVTRLAHLIVNIISGLFKVFSKLIGGILVFVSMLLLVSLTYLIFKNSIPVFIEDSGWYNIDIQNILVYFNDKQQVQWMLLSILAVIFIPALSLLINGVKLLFNLNIKTKYWNIASLVLWLFFGFSFAFAASDIGQSFTDKELKHQSFNFQTENELIVNHRSLSIDPNKVIIKNESDFIMDEEYLSINVPCKIIRTQDTTARVEYIYHAFGRNETEARNNIDKISFKIDFNNDTLNIDQFSQTKGLYRGQHVIVKIYIPFDLKIQEINTKAGKHKCQDYDEFWDE
ncbi:MAG: PspC domain-containing protein [Bacteroidales bacterium]|nr:PspC domain-containing protein [Bacteroidales bacterium]